MYVVSTCVLHVQSLVLYNLTTLRILCFDANCEVSRNVIFSPSLPAPSLGSDKFAHSLSVFISHVRCVSDDNN